ncbi:hypothetical protein [Halocynthiibacter styelae]|uniref:Uncharacterized protein n=1 Tax=Halocynthiibacter styelae TaxID=2761955 RepID=A0A8J7IC29_9RHOB|nr:hypothetical protein [Paenihalocynthiibacter styelae]MBI1492838.1 hypothetical protein [Paenihalocynthiibacter styelae]
MEQILMCKTCDAELSYPLTTIDTVSEMERLCSFADETPVSPARHFLLMEGEVLAARMKRIPGWEPRSNAWLNLEDLRETVGFTPHTERLMGCCSISSGYGPNRVCQCGEHVGTQSSDCYEYRMLEPVPTATYWKNTKE